MAQQFDAKLEAGGGGGAAVEVPPDAIAALGAPMKRPRVSVTVNGFAYDTRIAIYGGKAYIGVHKATREKLDIVPGDDVSVTIELLD